MNDTKKILPSSSFGVKKLFGKSKNKISFFLKILFYFIQVLSRVHILSSFIKSSYFIKFYQEFIFYQVLSRVHILSSFIKSSYFIKFYQEFIFYQVLSRVHILSSVIKSSYFETEYLKNFFSWWPEQPKYSYVFKNNY